MKLRILSLSFLLAASVAFGQTQPVKQSTKETAPNQPGVVVKQVKPAVQPEKTPSGQSQEAAPKTTPQKQSTNAVTPAKQQTTPQKQPTKTVTPQKQPKPVTPVKPTNKPNAVPGGTPTTTVKDITGYWLTANKASIIQFYKTGDVYNGKIVWLRQPNDKSGKPVTDINNPDKSKRKNQVVGSQMVYNLKYNPKTKMYEGGKVYQPQTGRTFDCKAKVTGNGNVLEITGIAGFSMISKTLTWSRTAGIPGKR